MPEMTMETWGSKKVLTATFDTLGGANLAVKKLQDLENKDLLNIEDTLTVSKNAWDKLDVHETTGDSARKGAGVGALAGAVVGLIFPPSLLATTALGATVGAMTEVLRDSTFDDSYVKAMGDTLQPGQSMLIAVVDPQWEEEIQAVLNGVASKIGWTAMDQDTTNAVARHATSG